MTLPQFHNGLRILRSIDAWELGDPTWWPQFRDEPYMFLIRADDEIASQIWQVMVNRGATRDSTQEE